MTRNYKISLISSVTIFLVGFLFLLIPTRSLAAVSYSRPANSNVFRINSFMELIANVSATNIANNPLLGIQISGDNIDIPTTLTGGTSANPGDFASLITSNEGRSGVTSGDAETLGYIKNLYQSLVNISTNNTDKQLAANDANAISAFLAAFNPLTDPNVQYSSSVSISPSSFIQNTDFSATVTANYYGPTAGLDCFLYVGTGTGSYKFKNTTPFNNGSTTCTPKWNVSGSEIANLSNGVQTTLRGFFVTFQASGWTHQDLIPGTPTSPAVIPLPAAQGSAEIVPKNPTASITIRLDKTSVVKGSDVNFSATVTNAGSFSSKECVYYLESDVSWVNAGTAQLPDCSLPLSTTNMEPGNYAFKMNLQDPGVDDDSSALPVSNIINLKVCDVGETSCATTGGGGGGTGGSTTTRTSFGTYNPVINTVEMYKNLKNGNLHTAEGIFELILSLAETLIGVLAFFAILIGGIQVVTSGGDATAAAKGKKSIMYGIIGMVVATLSYSIVIIIVKQLKSSGLIN